MADEVRLKKRASGPEFEQADELVLWAHDDGALRTTDEDGTVSAVGGGNGGSTPVGAFQTADFKFTEEATAGVYTATMVVPAGTTVLDVKLVPLASWQADDARIAMGDTANGAASYFDPANKAIQDICPNPYDPVNPASDDNYASLASDGTSSPDGYASSEIWGTDVPQAPGIYYVASDTITMEIDTTGMSNAPVVPTGVLLFRVHYIPPVTPDDAGFVAA